MTDQIVGYTDPPDRVRGLLALDGPSFEHLKVMKLAPNRNLYVDVTIAHRPQCT